MKDNKLIAEFMGIENDNAKMRGHLYECPVTAEYVSDLEYHTSWDWLMPVVQKCFDTQEPTEGQHYFINESLLTMDIEVVYDRVVEFIKAHKKYPFNEGDDYWVVEDGDLVWGVWDDISEEIHDESPDRIYFTEEEAIDYARKNGIKYK